MSRPAPILIFEPDVASASVIRGVLEVEPGVRLLVANDPADALALTRQEQPELLFVGHDGGDDELAFVRHLRGEAGHALATLVLVTATEDEGARRRALDAGVDEFLRRPVEAAEVRSRLRCLARLRRVFEQLRRDAIEMDRLHKAVSHSLDQVVKLLADLLEAARPGARERGRCLAELALQVGERFGMPPGRAHALDLAARLGEIGRVLMPGPRTGGPGMVPPWQQAQAARNLLEQVGGLQETASLIGSLQENWDGTGFPEHLQQGQIPLRCRILRMLTDFIGFLTERGQDRQAALERLAAHVGTCYDPMVLVHLEAVLAGTDEEKLRPQHTVLPVEELTVGMVLAEDLCTESGLKLLARGTLLGPGALETIRRRHVIEPILQGVNVERKAA